MISVRRDGERMSSREMTKSALTLLQVPFLDLNHYFRGEIPQDIYNETKYTNYMLIKCGINDIIFANIQQHSE